MKPRKKAFMHPADIKAALTKNNKSQRAIAQELNVSETIVYNVIGGANTSLRVAQAVAKATGYSIERMWPGRYTNVSQNDAA